MTTRRPEETAACGSRRPGWERPGPGRHRLPCIAPSGHDGAHRDAFGKTWEAVDAPHDAHLMRVDAPQVTALSIAHLMDAPLQQLVDELAITVTQTEINEPGFFGYAYVDGHGVTVALPPGRPELEHDCMARYLIGRAFNVDGLPPLPDLVRVIDLTAEVQHAQAAARRVDNEGQGSR